MPCSTDADITNHSTYLQHTGEEELANQQANKQSKGAHLEHVEFAVDLAAIHLVKNLHPGHPGARLRAASGGDRPSHWLRDGARGEGQAWRRTKTLKTIV